MSHSVNDKSDQAWKEAYGVRKQKERERVAQSRDKIDSILKRSIFQHNSAEEPLNKFHTWFDASPAKDNLGLNRNIRVNQSFIGVNWNVVGGSALAVLKHGTEGRVTKKQRCIRGMKSICSFDLSTHDTGLVAIGSGEGTIKLWRVPEGGLDKDLDVGDEVASFEASGKVTFCMFHPYVSGVLVTASQSYEGCQVDVWDVSDDGAVESKIQFAACKEGVSDISFDPHGQYLAVLGKDGKAIVVDPRTEVVRKEFSPAENGRDAHIMFTSTDRLITVGFGAGNRRSISLWDITGDCDKPLTKIDVPAGNNALSAHFDIRSQVLYVTNIGGSYVHLWHLHAEDEPYLEQLDNLKGKTDFAAHVFFPASVCDVKKVEVARSVKVDNNKAIMKLPWKVPRKRMEFFQDDVYPDCSQFDALMDADAFFSGKNEKGVVPNKVNRQPEGMDLLSTAPEPKLSVQQQRYLAHKAKEEAPPVKGVLGHESVEEVHDHFRNIAKTMPSKNRWDAQVDNSQVDVDEDEWD